MAASCDHAIIIEEINRVNEVLAQLRALLLPSTMSASDLRSQLARDLFEQTLHSLTAALSLLRPPRFDAAPMSSTALQFDMPNCGEENQIRGVEQYEGRRRKRPKQKLQIEPHQNNRCLVRANIAADCLTTVTTIPHNDGHQWKKYGQKHICEHQFQRNYYRCTNHKELSCPARKTVQQMDYSDPPNFTVSYIMDHTCKNGATHKPTTVAQINLQSDCSISSIKLEPIKLDEQEEIKPAACPVTEFDTCSTDDELAGLLCSPVATTSSSNWQWMFDNTDYHYDAWSTNSSDGSIWGY